MRCDTGGRRAFRVVLELALVGVAFAAFTSGRGLAADPLTPEEAVRKAIENFQNLQSCQYRIILHLTAGNAIQDSEYTFCYKKPNLIRMYVNEGKDRGSTVLLRKDGRIRGKAGGLLSLIALTLNDDDERLRDLWGRKFYKADWGTILEETEVTLKQATRSRVEEAEGGNEIVVIAEGENGSFEKTWLSADGKTLFKKQARKENGDTLDLRWTDVVLNPQFKEGFFDF